MALHYSVANVSECFFQHSMELPGIGEIKERSDLRDVGHDYSGERMHAFALKLLNIHKLRISGFH